MDKGVQPAHHLGKQSCPVRNLAWQLLEPARPSLNGCTRWLSQYRIVPDPTAMHRLDVTYSQIETAAARFGLNTGGGFVDQQGREYLIRNVGVTRRLDDLRNTVIAYRQDQPVMMHQVASVDFTARVKRGDAGFRGKPGRHPVGPEAAGGRYGGADPSD